MVGRQNGHRIMPFIYYNESLVSIFVTILRRARMNRVHIKSMKVTKRGVRVRSLYLIRDDEKKYINYTIPTTLRKRHGYINTALT